MLTINVVNATDFRKLPAVTEMFLVSIHVWECKGDEESWILKYVKDHNHEKTKYMNLSVLMDTVCT